jgi:amino acid transporter
MKKITLLPLIGIVYFTVSGGAFGLEELVSSTGPGLALLLLLLTPLLWSLPIALVTAEMSSMLPLQGGYYRWVYLAMGRFWGFQEGWWTWLYTFVDMALYPVLFADYARYFFPGLSGWQHWLVALLVIYSSLLINLLGARLVGRSAVLAFVVVTLPFLLFIVLGAARIQSAPWHPWAIPDQGLVQTLGLGLAVVVWNYSGWDNVSTFAGEVEEPGRNYPLALMASIPLVALLYLLPVGVGLGAAQNWREWQTGDFPRVAAQVVGPWLGAMMSLAVMFSVWSLFNNQLLYASRIPLAMAEDGFFPRWITRKHRRWETPYLSLLLSAVIYSFFALLDFRKLVVIDVLVYSAALLLELAALLLLRRRRPDLSRPFRIPGGRVGLVLVTGTIAAFMSACFIFSLVGQNNGWVQAGITMVMLLTGPPVYWIVRKVHRSSPEAAEWAAAFRLPGGRG